LVDAAKIRFLSTVMLVLTLSACAAAARILYPLELDPLKNKPGIYMLDPTHANIIFAVSHMGFSLHHGRFNRITGSLDLDTSSPVQSQVFVTIDTGSIDTNNAELDEKLRAKGMFDVKAFPIATYKSTSLQMTGENTARVDGMLTIKGIRRSVPVDATFIGSGTNPLTGKRTIGFSGKASFNRSEFELNDWLPLIGDRVSLTIEAEFQRTGN